MHFLPASLLGCLLLMLPGYAAAPSDEQTVRTPPVGIATLTVPAKSARALSVPLGNIADFTGTVTAVSSNTVTTSGAGWEINSWGPFSETPFVIRILSGTGAGQTLGIESNTTDSLTLDSAAADLLVPGDRYEIVPVDTLADIFGERGEGLLTGTVPAEVDNVLIHDGTQWNTYYNDGTKWLKEGAGSVSQNAVALLPDHGIFFVRKASAPLKLSIAGEVSLTKSASELPADALTFLANPFPLNTRLKDLQLQNNPSWQSGANADSADQVHIYSGRRWAVYFYDGRNWRGESGSRSNPLVLKGSAIVIERRGGQDMLHAPEPPYSLN